MARNWNWNWKLPRLAGLGWVGRPSPGQGHAACMCPSQIDGQQVDGIVKLASHSRHLAPRVGLLCPIPANPGSSSPSPLLYCHSYPFASVDRGAMHLSTVKHMTPLCSFLPPSLEPDFGRNGRVEQSRAEQKRIERA